MCHNQLFLMYFIVISKNENEDEKETSSTPFDIILLFYVHVQRFVVSKTLLCLLITHIRVYLQTFMSI